LDCVDCNSVFTPPAQISQEIMAASEVETVAPQSGNSPSEKQKAASPQKDETAVRKEAMNHFVAGKRHMLVQDIAAAVTSFAMACEMLSNQFGETSLECADAYFHYGKALLEMARLESGVLGNALEGVPEGEDTDSSQVEDPEKMTADEKEEVGVKVHEALDENFKTHEEKIALLTNGHAGTSTLPEITVNGDAVNGEVKTNGKLPDPIHSAIYPDESTEGSEEEEESHDEEAEDSEENKDGEKPVEAMDTDAEKVSTESVGEDDKSKAEKEAGDKEEQQAEDEEDPSNLQLAWEMLELAKVVYTKKVEEEKEEVSKAEYEKKLCETYLTLGEVSLENENYPQAVDDLTACLKKRQEKLPKDNRSIAETHYQLGVALGFYCQFEEAVKSLNDAIDVLDLRIKNLKEKTESKDETRTDDAFYTREREIEELEKLLPEIREKIVDTNEMKVETVRKMKEQAGVGFENGAASSSSSGDKPVATIAVKKRAHSQEEVKISPKKAHLENGS